MTNLAILIGNLGADPEVRTLQDGSQVATISVATSETWRDRNTGERREKTEWHRVTVFGGSASYVAKFFKKGTKVEVHGAIRTRKWQDQSGQDRYTTEVVVSGFSSKVTALANWKNEGDDGGYSSQSNSSKRQGEMPPAGQTYEPGPYDDEIPF